jgi:hypothetical protein
MILAIWLRLDCMTQQKMCIDQACSGRTIERKVIEPSQSLLHTLALAKRLHAQQPKDKQKLTSWHAPEVECIGKGKARKPDEFGVKATITTTLKEGLVIGMRTLPGNPYDGRSLREALEQTRIQDTALAPHLVATALLRGLNSTLPCRRICSSTGNTWHYECRALCTDLQSFDRLRLPSGSIQSVSL